MEIEAAWLHFVEGLTQAEIASRRGLSRMRVHRLIQAAQEKGYVKIFVDRVPRHCVEVEEELIGKFGLTICTIVPVDEPRSMHDSLQLIGKATALFLHGMLEPTTERVIGIGSGRTVAAASQYLPEIHRPHTTFVSATGDFAALSNANPFEVINTLIRKTGGRGFALTAPLILEEKAERDLFLNQRAVRHVLEKLKLAEFFLIGLGHVGVNSYLDSYNLLHDMSTEDLRREGVVADLAGHFLDEQGRLISGVIADRVLTVAHDVLLEKPVYVACSGAEKAEALRAALRSGLVNGLIATSDVAKAALQS